MKLFSKITMFVLAVLSIAACSQNDVLPEDINPNVDNGEKTWAYFSFSFVNSQTRAGNGGTEDGITAESAIVNAAAYIFKVDGSLEAKAVGEANNNHIPGVAVEVTDRKSVG